MVKIICCNRPMKFRDGATIMNVVGGEKNLKKISGVWVNGEHIHPEDFDKYVLQENDKLKIQYVFCGG
jgi:sulfur carrier protein ThiS